MKDNELNLEIYRQAWQRESRRLEASAPTHTEEEILAILERGNKKQEHKRLPLWIASAAASILLLIGALMLLTDRDNTPADLPGRYATQEQPGTKHPTQPTTDSQTQTDGELVQPDAERLPLPGAELLMPPMANNQTLPATIILADTVTDIQQERSMTTPPAIHVAPSSPEKQAFDPSNQDKAIDKKVMDSWLQEQMDEYGTGSSEYNPLTGHSTVSLLVGYDWGKTPVVGGELRIEYLAHGNLSTNRLMTITYDGKNTESAVLISYSGGLSYHPAEPLTINMNMGAYLGFEEFEAGLLADLAASWNLTKHLAVGAGYRRLIPFGNDGHNIWYIVIGYRTE